MKIITMFILLQIVTSRSISSIVVNSAVIPWIFFLRKATLWSAQYSHHISLRLVEGKNSSMFCTIRFGLQTIGEQVLCC